MAVMMEEIPGEWCSTGPAVQCAVMTGVGWLVGGVQDSAYLKVVCVCVYVHVRKLQRLICSVACEPRGACNELRWK